MRLLVIEDEFPMRIALVKTLQAEGYRVVSAVDGPGGLESTDMLSAGKYGNAVSRCPS
jgi:DNA-binding response OmpR family regulator